MKLKSVILDIAVLVLTIPIVIALFKTLPLREAALIAGVLFIFVPAALMIRRLRNPLNDKAARIVWWAGLLSFWLGFAWPILLVRLFNWDAEFNSLTIFGQPAPVWHEYANASYKVMLVAVVVAGFLESRKARQK